MRFLPGLALLVTVLTLACTSRAIDPDDGLLTDLAGDIAGADDVGSADAVIADAEVAEDAAVDSPAEADACLPDCLNRECGPDGCGGSCGSCLQELDCGSPRACDDLVGRCAATCCWQPDLELAGNPTGSLKSFAIPPASPESRLRCHDFGGDGVGDNGSQVWATNANPALADLIARGDFTLIFSWGDKDVPVCGRWPLVVLPGSLATDTGTSPPEFRLSNEAIVQETCAPLNFYCNATIENARLRVGPGPLQLSIPFPDGLNVVLSLAEARFEADVAAASGTDGLALKNGVLSAVITKPSMQATWDKLEIVCNSAPVESKPSWCSFFDISFSALLLFDLHMEADGSYSQKSKEKPGDAESVCVFFETAPARVVGVAP